MVRFEELQELWQSQAAAAAPAFDARGLTVELRRFGRQQTWINTLKVGVLAVMLFRILSRSHWTPLALSGMVLMYAGLVTYLVLDWRNQIGISRLDFSAPSVEFIRGARARLQHQLNPMRTMFWPLVVTIGGGFNLFLMAHPEGPLYARVARHLTATALPFAAYILGQKIREFRFRRECGAVMERLDALVRALEERTA
jgi:hypothetical protein